MPGSFSIRTAGATSVGRVAAGLSRALGKGEGSVIGGRVALALDRNALRNLASGRRIAIVSGTNGKTTTTSMLAAAMATAGEVVTSEAGANMFGGMVSALSRSRATVGVLETDEGYLPGALLEMKPALAVLLNLTRDQLDRVGEVRLTAQRWREALKDSSTLVVANADDPMVVWAAEAATTTVWVAAGSGWRHDASACPSCGGRIDWGSGEWMCTNCPLKRPSPHAFFASKDIAERRVTEELRLPVELRIPGEVNRRNAAMAITAALLLGANPQRANVAIANLEGAGGRFRSVHLGGVPVRLILAKNPAGWAEALRMIRPGSTPVVVAINARPQDGRDPSWLWDVPFEQMRGRYLVATGERGRDLAVRLHYGEVEHEFVDGLLQSAQHAATHLYEVAEAEMSAESSVDLEQLEEIVRTTEIDVIANYSAFQEFRRIVEE